MKINRSYESWKLYLLQKSLRSLAMFASLLICLITNAALAQVTTAPSEREPVDPSREKLKEAYFEKLEKVEITPATEVEAVQPTQKVDPTSKKPNAGLPAGHPVFVDTGNPEADKEAYRIAKDAWIAQNPALYEGMTQPSQPTNVQLEERKRILKTN
jgi:hypothetical protein